MKLLDRESLLIAALELHASRPTAQLQKLTGLKAHTIRYTLHRLLEREIIRFQPFINLGALGLTQYTILFSLSASNRSARSRFLTHLKKLRRITWLAELGGEYQYALSIATSSHASLQETLGHMVNDFGEIFLDKVGSLQFSYARLPRRYLVQKDIRATPLITRPLDQVASIDALDSRIISALVTSNYASHRQIAHSLQIPLSTMELRIKELEKKGIIQGYSLFVDVSKLNIQHFKLLLFARGMSVTLKERLKEFIVSRKNIVYIVECFGNWDFELGVEVYDPQELSPLVHDLQDRMGESLSAIKLVQKFRDLKSVTFPVEILEGEEQ